MELNKKMEIIEKRTSSTTKELDKIIRQLDFIPIKAHGLSEDEIITLINAYNILNKLEENLYFNSEIRKERF